MDDSQIIADLALHARNEALKTINRICAVAPDPNRARMACMATVCGGIMPALEAYPPGYAMYLGQLAIYREAFDAAFGSGNRPAAQQEG